MSLALAEIDWNSLLLHDLFPVLVLLGVVGLIGVTAIIAVQWRKAQELRLKEKMIDRGFTADEIVQIINARVSEKRRCQTAHSADRADTIAG